MNCPGCGAVMSLAGNRRHLVCSYCSRVHFPEPTDEGLRLLGEVVGVGCPICSLPLQAAVIEDEPVQYCEQCRGFLTHTDRFAQIVARRRSQCATVERTRPPFDSRELKRILRCPDCQRRMETHPYYGGGNAVVDSCSRCRLIWLDAGELSVIASYLPHQHRIEPVLRLPDSGTIGTSLGCAVGGYDDLTLEDLL